MSTQAARSILFTHTSPQQGFRLLELPPELVELLSSKDAPVLELKSPSQSLSQTATEADYVNLCTPTKTYRIRQVQSSNPLHILRPSDGGVQRGDINMVGDEEDDGLNLVDTMTCIAKCGSTLELHTPPEGFSAISFLDRMVRLYEGDEDVEGDAQAEADAEQNRIIQRLFADVPVSRAQCERGWIELCAFVLGRGANNDPTTCCWRPSAKVKLDVWKRAMEGAVLQGIDLAKQFLVSDLWGSVLDEGEEPFPRPLFEAVIRRVCELEDGPGQLRAGAGAQVKWASIDKDSCIPWVGQTYLEAMAPTSNSAVGRSEFLNAWKNYLPESWRDEVALSKLTDGSYKYPDQTSICFVSEADRHKVKTNPSTNASATVAKKSRNWHEVFKNQKRQKQ